MSDLYHAFYCVKKKEVMLPHPVQWKFTLITPGLAAFQIVTTKLIFLLKLTNFDLFRLGGCFSTYGTPFMGEETNVLIFRSEIYRHLI